MTLHFKTAPYSYSGPDRVDVTRQGNKRAPSAGEAFAPSDTILWPAKSHLALVEALERRAATDAVRGTQAEPWLLLEAEKLLAEVETAYEREYIAEMKQSWRAMRPAWNALLARETATLCCFCPARVPTAGVQRHHCHRSYLASILVKCGAVDDGEVPASPPKGQRRRDDSPPVSNLYAFTGARPPPMEQARQYRDAYKRVQVDVAAAVASLPRDAVIVHGGAKGVDMVAAAAAARTGRKDICYDPWWDAWGKRAPLVRNVYVGTAHVVFAWPMPWGSGSQGAVKLATAAGCNVVVRTDVDGALLPR